MTNIKIEINDTGVTAAFNRLREAALRPGPALRAIGEALYRQTRRTFETSTDPWGRRWQPNRPVTLARFAAGFKGKANFKKDGTLSGKGQARLDAKKPLIGAGRFLSGPSLHHDVAGNELTVGSSAVYAAIQQFGGKKAEFAHLWGDIPARPFLPVDAAGNLAPQARAAVTEVIQEYLLASGK